MNPRIMAGCMAGLVAGCSAPTFELPRPTGQFVVPDRLDVGPVPAGSTVERRLEVANLGSGPVDILSLELLGSFEASTHRFDVSLALGRLDPGATREIAVRFEAREASDPIEAEVEVRFVDTGLDPSAAQAVRVVLAAQVSATGLWIEPNPLRFGPVRLGQPASGTLRITNLRSAPVVVLAVQHEAGFAQYETHQARGTFGPLPGVSGDGELVELAGGETWTVEIEYTAPLDPGDGKEQATWRIAECPEPRCRVPAILQAELDEGGPRLELRPNPIDFSDIALGSELERYVAIQNVGDAPAHISGASVTMGQDSFRFESTGVDIEPGREVHWRVIFRPAAAGEFEGLIIVESNDVSRPEIELEMTGVGVDLPPCAYEVEPAFVDFGLVELADSRTYQVRIRNIGDEECLLWEPRIIREAGTEPGVFALEDAPIPSQRLAPGDEFVIRVTFTPLTEGLAEANLRIFVSNGADAEIDVPLRGEGGSGLVAVCSAARTIRAGQPVLLTGHAITNGLIVSRLWTVVSAPMGGAGTPGQWDPDPPTQPIVEFLPFLVGEYVVQMEVIDDEGRSSSCTTEITAQGRGLQTTLTWDGVGDVDLHLHRQSARPWFTEDDCYFGEPVPLWDPAVPVGQGPNPRLDFDDTSDDGPENIRLLEPVVGEVYTIAAHGFAEAQGRRATVQVFCGAGISVAATFVSRPLRGTSTVQCSSNDFWKVAEVVFSAPDRCTVRPLDEYIPASQACERF